MTRLSHAPGLLFLVAVLVLTFTTAESAPDWTVIDNPPDIDEALGRRWYDARDLTYPHIGISFGVDALQAVMDVRGMSTAPHCNAPHRFACGSVTMDLFWCCG